MRDDDRAFLAEVLVAAAVVEVPVRVDHETHGLRIERFRRFEDFRGEGRNWSSTKKVPSSP